MCGGIGTRLRPLSYYLQKSMIPLGRREKPLLEYVVRLLAYHNLKDILLLADYKQEQIVNYFEDGSRFNVKLTYLKDDPSFKGSLGALHNAYVKGLLRPEDNFLVYYGDIISNLNLTKLMQTHGQSHAAATLALTGKYPVPVGVARLEGDKVVEFTEKPDFGQPVSIGMLALNGRCLNENLSPPHKESLDLMGDLIPHLIRSGQTVASYVSDAYWYDVGSLEKYEKLSDDLIEENLAFLFNMGT